MPQNSETTGAGLSDQDILEGLLDYGLFSEVLPPCFVSKKLSKCIASELMPILKMRNSNKLRRFMQNRVRDFIRFEPLSHYNIPRQFGIPHPESYVVQSLVIQRCWAMIKRHCAKPRIPVSRIFVHRMDNERIFVMNYPGDKSTQEAREEQDIISQIGARYLVHTDISRCFPSIYSHSIPWALLGFTKAKEQRQLSLGGNLLDAATRGVSDGQTNGILIGPHASNIISEIVLTQIDVKMLQKYNYFYRNIDDYVFYAKTQTECEAFIRDLEFNLRRFNLSLNPNKTNLCELPQATEEYWVRMLRSFPWPEPSEAKPDIEFKTVRLFMDLALDLSKKWQHFAVLNYAIKSVPPRLDKYAKSLFVQEVINLIILYPYLTFVFERYVIEKHEYTNTGDIFPKLIKELLAIGLRKLYPAAITFALYFALKYKYPVPSISRDFRKIIQIADCLSLTLLREYARFFKVPEVLKAVDRFSYKLETMSQQEQDRYWLLIYQSWSVDKLKKAKQLFLAELKRKQFCFIKIDRRQRKKGTVPRFGPKMK